MLQGAGQNTTRGEVTEVTGPIVVASLAGATAGSLAEITVGSNIVRAEITQVSGYRASLALIDNGIGIHIGDRVSSSGEFARVACGEFMRGNIYDALGTPLCDSAPIDYQSAVWRTVDAPPPELPYRETGSPSKLITGVACIDRCIPIGHGQRLSLIAEPGAGKSTLIRSISSGATDTVQVIALIGERGRESAEWARRLARGELGSNVVIISSTSNEPAARKILAAQTAMTVAEYFANCGHHTLLHIDSFSRLLRAKRELALLAGEIPVRGGYPASVWSFIPRYLERAGSFRRGSIAVLCTLLGTSNWDEDPMIEEVMSVTDGHIRLSGELASRGIFPAIDVVQSISRFSQQLLSAEDLRRNTSLRKSLSMIEQLEQAAQFGASQPEHIRILSEKLRVLLHCTEVAGEAANADLDACCAEIANAFSSSAVSFFEERK